MTTTSADDQQRALMQTLPGDDIRQIMWGYADRFDVQMAVQSARSVARGLVAEDRRAPVDALVLLGDNFYPYGLQRFELLEQALVMSDAALIRQMYASKLDERGLGGFIRAGK